MIQIDISGKPAKLWFKHERKPLINYGLTPVLCTECAICGEDPDKPLALGRAICAKGDNFCKNTGRKIALSRAIKDYDKPTRKKIWDAYFEARGKF